MTTGKSRAPTPQINTLECRRSVCPEPGMCAKAFFFVLNLLFTTGLLAELGLRGVHILNLKTMPLRWGDSFSLGLFHFLTLKVKAIRCQRTF